MKTSDIFIIPGGPGLSNDYMLEFSNELEKNNSVFMFDYESILTFKEIKDSLKDKIKHNSNTKTIFIAHSWGALILSSCLQELKLFNNLTIFINPVALDRSEYDKNGECLLSRIDDITMKKISNIMEKNESGSKIMQLALHAYCGKTKNLPNFNFEYDYNTYNSVAASLTDFNYWEDLKKLTKLRCIFGNNDYISNRPYINHNIKIINNNYGHFPMIENNTVLIQTIRNILKNQS